MLQAQEQPRNRRPLRLMERSVFSDRMVFVRAVHEAKYMSDMEISIYDSWFSPIVSLLQSTIYDRRVFWSCRGPLVGFLRAVVIDYACCQNAKVVMRGGRLSF